VAESSRSLDRHVSSARHNRGVGRQHPNAIPLPYCSTRPCDIASEPELVGLALALGAERVQGWSAREAELAAALQPPNPPRQHVDEVREAIAAGSDPLGDAFTSKRSAQARRPFGATYTPGEIVAAMLAWAQSEGQPERVVDPGAGSGRFAVAAGRRFARAEIIAIEIDPLAAILARGHLAAAGLAKRSHVVVADYRTFRPDTIDGETLYVGNPPYVRHHQIEPRWKEWLVASARARGLRASQLSGLHVHFFLATLSHAAPRDYGAFITSAEWLDVNYGTLVRNLVLDGLGGHAIHLLEPTATPFEDAATTAAITCFRIGEQPRSVRLRRVKSVRELGKLDRGQAVGRDRLAAAPRWTPLTRPPRKVPEGHIELGEICRVHRGAVTGANATWIVEPGSSGLPAAVLFPSVTRARELFEAATVLARADHLRLVIDIPPDLDALEDGERVAIERFLRSAKRRGAANGYIAQHRSAWWSVGLHRPAPILATYMARRPPVFIRNLVQARHINIAHGIYPREPVEAAVLDALAAHLRNSVSVEYGRTYAGGLTKFEPREMERLPIPDLAALADSAARTAAERRKAVRSLSRCSQKRNTPASWASISRRTS
jgi:adenine-specific DNA-methyltransferase